MMHSLYLRKMYLENKLVEAGGITLGGVPIDLGKIKTPVYWLSTKDDHIAPWKSTYMATQIYQGPKRFVLSASGHIAGVINPPPPPINTVTGPMPKPRLILRLILQRRPSTRVPGGLTGRNGSRNTPAALCRQEAPARAG